MSFFNCLSFRNNFFSQHKKNQAENIRNRWQAHRNSMRRDALKRMNFRCFVLNVSHIKNQCAGHWQTVWAHFTSISGNIFFLNTVNHRPAHRSSLCAAVCVEGNKSLPDRIKWWKWVKKKILRVFGKPWCWLNPWNRILEGSDDYLSYPKAIGLFSTKAREPDFY